MRAVEVAEIEILRGRYGADNVDHDSLPMYGAFAQAALLANRCMRCGYWHLPPRPVCPSCWSFAITPTKVRGGGTVFTTTTIRVQAPSKAPARRIVVVVDLDEQEGLRITGRLLAIDPPGPLIGSRVQLAWTHEGDVAIPAFRLESETKMSG
jgi:uncharacterized protein